MQLLRYRLGTLGLQNLPSVNREMRLILGRFPGMRNALRVLFNIKRLGRGLEGVDLQLTLSLLATAVILLKWIGERQKTIERREQEHEALIRRERGLTHDQYLNLMTEWQGFYRSRPG